MNGVDQHDSANLLTKFQVQSGESQGNSYSMTVQGIRPVPEFPSIIVNLTLYPVFQNLYMKRGFFIKTKLISMSKSILCASLRCDRGNLNVMDQLQCSCICMSLSDSSTQFDFQLFHSLLIVFSPNPNCYPIQVQLPSANDCAASTHHVNPAAILILLSLTEWQLHGACTPRQHPRSLTLLVLLYTPAPQSHVAAFIPAVAISKLFAPLS